VEETINVKGRAKCAIAIGLLETMACCSPCSYESSFVVRVASGKALWLWACVYVFFSGKHCKCRTAQRFSNRAPAGKAVGKAGTLGAQRARAGGYERWRFVSFFS